MDPATFHYVDFASSVLLSYLQYTTRTPHFHTQSVVKHTQTTNARCFTGTRSCWACWLPLLARQRWPMPPACKRPSLRTLENIIRRHKTTSTSRGDLADGVSSTKLPPEHRPQHRRNGNYPRIGGPITTLLRHRQHLRTIRASPVNTELPHLGLEERSVVAKIVSSSIPPFTSKPPTYVQRRATNMFLE